jgi:hypothetical protein
MDHLVPMCFNMDVDVCCPLTCLWLPLHKQRSDSDKTREKPREDSVLERRVECEPNQSGVYVLLRLMGRCGCQWAYVLIWWMYDVELMCWCVEKRIRGNNEHGMVCLVRGVGMRRRSKRTNSNINNHQHTTQNPTFNRRTATQQQQSPVFLHFKYQTWISWRSFGAIFGEFLLVLVSSSQTSGGFLGKFWFVSKSMLGLFTWSDSVVVIVQIGREKLRFRYSSPTTLKLS